MDTLIVFTSFFLLLGWCIYYLIRYTATTVGDDSPLQREVSYHYEASDFLRWTNSPLLGFVCLIMGWGCWKIVAAMPPTTRFWYYPILLIFVGVSLGSFYLFSQLVRLEINLWTMIRGTTVLADPATKSITIQRAGTSTVLKADTIAFIEGHLTKQGKITYNHYRFVSQQGHAICFYDYGKGLPYAIEAYFKGVPRQAVLHSFPSDDVPVC